MSKKDTIKNSSRFPGFIEMAVTNINSFKKCVFLFKEVKEVKSIIVTPLMRKNQTGS